MSDDPEPTEPCGNEDCDLCYPLPWFEVSTARVQQLTHTRKIKAKDAEEALRIYNEGVEWPSSYDDHGGEVLEEHPTKVAELPLHNQLDPGWDCWHRLPSSQAFAMRGAAHDEFDVVVTPPLNASTIRDVAAYLLDRADQYDTDSPCWVALSDAAHNLMIGEVQAAKNNGDLTVDVYARCDSFAGKPKQLDAQLGVDVEDRFHDQD